MAEPGPGAAESAIFVGAVHERKIPPADPQTLLSERGATYQKNTTVRVFYLLPTAA
jgi:hypothetical protein